MAENPPVKACRNWSRIDKMHTKSEQIKGCDFLNTDFFVVIKILGDYAFFVNSSKTRNSTF